MIRTTHIVTIVLGLALLGASPASAVPDPNYYVAITGHISPVVTRGHCTTAKQAINVSMIDYESSWGATRRSAILSGSSCAMDPTPWEWRG